MGGVIRLPQEKLLLLYGLTWHLPNVTRMVWSRDLDKPDETSEVETVDKFPCEPLEARGGNVTEIHRPGEERIKYLEHSFGIHRS